MEFLLGAIVSWLVIMHAEKRFSKQIEKNGILKPFQSSQSRVHNLTNGMSVNYWVQKPQKVTQSIAYHDRTALRIVLLDDNAYWIRNNALYVAEYDGIKLDESKGQKVDTRVLDDVELKKIMLVIDKLNEGKSNNDRGYPGNQSL